MFSLVSAIANAYVRSPIFYLYLLAVAFSFTDLATYLWALAGLIAATRLDLKSVLRLEVKSLRWDFINAALVSMLTLPLFPFATFLALLILTGVYRRWPYAAAYYALFAAAPIHLALAVLPAVAFMRLPLLPQFTVGRYVITANGVTYLAVALAAMLYLLPGGPHFQIHLKGYDISSIPRDWPLWGFWLFAGIHFALYISAATLPYRAMSLYYYVRTGPVSRIDRVLLDILVLYMLSASAAAAAAWAVSTRVEVDFRLSLLLALWAAAVFSLPQRADEWAASSLGLYYLFAPLLGWLASQYGLWTSVAAGVATALVFRLYWTKILEVGHVVAKALKALR